MVVGVFGQEAQPAATNAAPASEATAPSAPADTNAASTNAPATPPPADISQLPREDWPKEVTLKVVTEFQMLDGGKPIGSFKMQPGKKVGLLEIKGDKLRVGDASGEATVAASDTDIVERVAALKKSKEEKAAAKAETPAPGTPDSANAAKPAATPAAEVDPELQPGAVLEMSFPKMADDYNGQPAMCHVQLPPDYDPTKKYRLAVWFSGGEGGNQPCRGFYPESEYVIMGVPFLKNPPTSKNGFFTDLERDYAAVWNNTRTMIDAVLKKVPNVQKGKGILAGYSNGGHTVELCLRVRKAKGTNAEDYFSIFMLSSGGGMGMGPNFPSLKHCFAYICWGEKEGPEGFGHGGVRVIKSFKDAGATVVNSVIKDAGHDFTDSEKAKVKEWIETKVLPELNKSESH